MRTWQVWVVVSAAVLNGWLAHAQGPSVPRIDPANPRGIPAPIDPDAKFRPADPFAVPAPTPLPAEARPRYYPNQSMPGYYPPGMMMPPNGYPPPGMMMPPGRVPNGYGMYPGMPLQPMPNGPPGMTKDGRWLPPLSGPPPGVGRGEPFLPPEGDRLPPSQSPRPNQVGAQPALAPDVGIESFVMATSLAEPGNPFAAQEPYVVYEGVPLLKKIFSPQVQTTYWVWCNAEYLLWQPSDSPAPPALATTAPAGSPALLGGLPRGSLGRADTTIVLGGQPIEPINRNGFRVALGTWLNSEQSIGMESSYTLLAARMRADTFSSAGGVGDVSLSNPFLDVNPASPGENSNSLTFLGALGGATLSLSSQFQGAELSLVHRTYDYQGITIDALVGFRWLNLWENLEFSTLQNGAIGGVAAFANTLDQFKTLNNLYGGQLGLRTDYQYRGFFVSATAKIGYGSVSEVANINGQFTTNAGPNYATIIPTATAVGGVYALPTNIGRFDRQGDAWLGEATVNVGVTLWKSLRIYGGYDFLYLSQVLRPGEQIDRTLNSSQMPVFAANLNPVLVGAARPAFAFRESDFWVRGLTVGLEWRY